jgi:hypothetical protein
LVNPKSAFRGLHRASRNVLFKVTQNEALEIYIDALNLGTIPLWMIPLNSLCTSGRQYGKNATPLQSRRVFAFGIAWLAQRFLRFPPFPTFGCPNLWLDVSQREDVNEWQMKTSVLDSLRSTGLTRRRFLARTTVAAAGTTLVPRHVLGGAKFVPPSEKVHVAIVGCGGQGQTNVRALFGEADAQIIALADPAESQDLHAFYI